MLKKLKDNWIVDLCVTTVLLGLMCYSAYSLWYIFEGAQSGFDIQLYTILTGLALGWSVFVLVKTLFKNAHWAVKLVAFLAGNALFHGMFWRINTKINPIINDDTFNDDNVVINAYTVAFLVTGVLLLIAFIVKAIKKPRIFNAIFAVIYFVVSCGGVIILNEENIKALDYKKNIQFGTIGAAEANVSVEEKELCRKWFDENLLNTVTNNLPFTFKVDGEEFSISDWSEINITEAPEKYQGGKTQNIIFTNKNNGLEVTVEATLFTENATCQWTVYIKNTGTENSGVISDFYALNSSLGTGKAELYYSMGSDTAASDFSLIKKNLSSSERKFSATDGKPTESFLPYFNIFGENFGAVLGIGWTGQWAASFSSKNDETNVTVKQESFNAHLLPGEEVRSPLVSISFYETDNALKGFNMFREWIMDCVYPENVTKSSYTVMEVAGPVSTRTSDEIIEVLNGLDKKVFTHTDAFWMDAGWYSYNSGWYDGVGNWTVDTSRYDNGIIELSDYAKKKGLKHTLWYEPERVIAGTHFHTVGSENEKWLVSIDGEENIMWNLADEDALKYYCDYLLKSLKENGVTIYRQDFNFAPLKYWQKADSEYYDGRTGICENHYVTNEYKFLDYLTENVPGLIIDNCASGGKRLDLEMAYRSIPFWRSDYNCAYHYDLFDATQSHTYGISFWLPITGSALYMANEYACRSAIMPLMLMDFFSHQNPEFQYYNEQRAQMGERYYPLDFGSFDKDKMLAMQFSTDDASSGMALIYKRSEVTDTEYTLYLNGLHTATKYKLYDIDNPEKVYTMEGIELMNYGLTLPLPEGEKAMIIMFEAEK
ncbi:MAG: alpha-galactosidase [Ruminococcaceae bacterium]|nr:alpha-galactosidase [Oscillospiraceae bacterium]